MCEVLYDMPLLPEDMFFYAGAVAVVLGLVALGLSPFGKTIVSTFGLRVKPSWLPPGAFFAIWGSMAGAIGVMFIAFTGPSHFSYRSAYHDGNYETVEGVVKVLHEQPFDGHAPGDKITLGGQELVIDAYKLSPGYKTTLAKGGVHHDGRTLKMAVIDGSIVHICEPR